MALYDMARRGSTILKKLEEKKNPERGERFFYKNLLFI